MNFAGTLSFVHMQQTQRVESKQDLGKKAVFLEFIYEIITYKMVWFLRMHFKNSTYNFLCAFYSEVLIHDFLIKYQQRKN